MPYRTQFLDVAQEEVNNLRLPSDRNYQVQNFRSLFGRLPR